MQSASLSSCFGLMAGSMLRGHCNNFCTSTKYRIELVLYVHNLRNTHQFISPHNGSCRKKKIQKNEQHSPFNSVLIMCRLVLIMFRQCSSQPRAQVSKAELATSLGFGRFCHCGDLTRAITRMLIPSRVFLQCSCLLYELHSIIVITG